MIKVIIKQKTMDRHDFWDNQPVSRLNESVGIIDKKLTKYHNDIETPLPNGLKWAELDIHNDIELNALVIFLKRNYLTENENITLSFSKELIKWSLDINKNNFKLNKLNSLKCLSICIKKDFKILGFITATPTYIKINDQINETIVINFLCVHTQLRKFRLASILITELIRRTRTHAPHLLISPIFTAKNLPFKNIFKTQYYFRYLNIENLNKNNFIKNISYMDYKIYPTKINMIPMQIEHLDDVLLIFKKNLLKKKLSINFVSKEQFYEYFGNNFINGKLVGPIYTFVIISDNNVTDWVSFYSLPYKMNETENKLNVANLLRVESIVTPISDILNSIFKISKDLGFDLFCLLNFYDLEKYKELKLETENATVQYYTYNYECGLISPYDTSLILP